MVDFDITRDEGASTIHSGLKGFVYHTVLASFKHEETGAWVCIEHVAGNQAMMIVIWRAVPSWGGKTVAMIKSFFEPDLDIAWAHALEIAKNAHERGPKGEVRSRALETNETYKQGKSKAGTTGGIKSGEARAKTAEILKTERAEVLRAYEPLIHYKLAKYDPKFWTMGPIYEGLWKWNVRFKHKTAPTCWCNMIVPEEDHHKAQVWRSFYIGANEDNGMTHEMLAEFTDDFDPAFVILERLLASDPMTWDRGAFKAFL